MSLEERIDWRKSERNCSPKRWVWLVNLIDRNGWTTGVEVGCKEGENLGYIMDHCPDLFMYAVDPWEEQPGEQEDYVGLADGWHKKFLSRMNNHKDRVSVIRDYSVDAAKEFVGKVDFVFIDAQHTYDACKADIEAWRGKCRFICGHDYWDAFPGIEQAVNESFPDHEIILGPNTCWAVDLDR